MLDTFVKSKISNCLTQILPLAYADTYYVCTYMLYGLDRVETLTTITFPLLVTVK